MNPSERQAYFDSAFGPVLADIARHASVTERFLDKERVRIMVATLWANVVLDPEDAGLDPDDLEALHDFINERLLELLGGDESLKGCFRFLTGKAGEAAMRNARLPQQHQDLLTYFASVILDPEGHRRWMESVSDRPER